MDVGNKHVLMTSRSPEVNLFSNQLLALQNNKNNQLISDGSKTWIDKDECVPDRNDVSIMIAIKINMILTAKIK